MNTYWFFDSALKRDTCGAKNIPGKLIKDSCNPLFVEGINEPLEKPWEQQIGNGYPNVFYDPLVHKFRCYYTAFLAKDTNQSASIQTYNAKERRTTAILYAESENGLQWVKPSLGIVEYQSSKENNILALSTHGASVGLSKDDCYPIVTSSNHAALRWQNEKAPEGACMLKFYCNNAVLYSIAGDITIHPVHPL